MRKTILFTLLALMIWPICKGQEKPISIFIQGNIFNLSDPTIEILQAYQKEEKVLLTTKADKQGNFQLSGQLPAMDYYLFQISSGEQITLILKGNDSLKIYGDGTNFVQFSNIINSAESTRLNEFIKESNEYKQKLDSTQQYLKANPSQQAAVNASFKPIFDDFKGKRQYFIANNAYSPALIAVIGTFMIDQEFSVYESVVKQLKLAFGQSPTVQQVVADYDQVKLEIEKNKPFQRGSPALDFELPNPDSVMMKLSDFKGKIVLLDFWASWCGPCRKENPNVVAMYEKYNKDGFEVFSVSLDKDKQRWIQAIEKDKLVWDGHVSDLKYWQNEAARLYQVNSIPHTVLIDRDGNIIATKVRGIQLEQILQSIFGY